MRFEPRGILLRVAFLSVIVILLATSQMSADDPVEIKQRAGLQKGSTEATQIVDQVILSATGGLAASGDTVYAPAGATVRLCAASQPEGCESFINWEAPGGSPSSGVGASFETVYGATGIRILRVTCGDASDSVYVVAYTVSLTELAFDWESGEFRDAVDIRVNRTTDVLKPEWRSTGRNEPIAYVRTTRPLVKAKFTVDPPVISQLTISAEAPEPWDGFPERVIAFSGGVSVPEQVPLLMMGQAPATVDRDTVAVDWYVRGPNGIRSEAYEFASSGPHPIYTLLASPNAPMAEPWSEVLYYACWFGRGSSTEAEVVANLVTEVYWSSNLIYYPYYTYSSGYDGINLTAFLNDIRHSSFVYVDCRDCSHWAHLQSNALGMTGEYNTLGYSFQTNYVRDMGQDYWHTWAFNFHQVGYFWDAMVGDMAAACDGDGDPTSPPHTELLAVGDINLDDYLDVFTEATWVHSVDQGICNPY